MGIVDSEPFTLEWIPNTPGTYLLDAVATDNDGAPSISVAALVTVTTPEPPPSADGTLTLQRGASNYAGVADTYLSNFHRSTNFGASARMEFQGTSYQPLIRFAIFQSEGGPVPDGARIESAKLSLHKGAYDSVISLHAMNVPWVEAEATWNRPRIGATWAVAGAAGAGADYDLTPDAQVSAPWASGWVNFDVTSRIQTIVQGGDNFGWKLVHLSGNSNRKEFRSSDYISDPSLRPRLEIRWAE